MSLSDYFFICIEICCYIFLFTLSHVSGFLCWQYWLLLPEYYYHPIHWHCPRGASGVSTNCSRSCGFCFVWVNANCSYPSTTLSFIIGYTELKWVTEVKWVIKVNHYFLLTLRSQSLKLPSWIALATVLLIQPLLFWHSFEACPLRKKEVWLFRYAFFQCPDKLWLNLKWWVMKQLISDNIVGKILQNKFLNQCLTN